jgi:hypothetical protein
MLSGVLSLGEKPVACATEAVLCAGVLMASTALCGLVWDIPRSLTRPVTWADSSGP